MHHLIALAAAGFAADEIIVTSERRATDRRDAPASISLLGTDDLRRIAPDHPAEALNRIAGAYVHRGSGQEHLTAIRSPVLTGGAGAGSFLILEDGVPVRAPAFANVNELFETSLEFADAVEVAKGPSGAFYGANAIHGVVNVRTPSAADDRTQAAFSVDTIGRTKLSGVYARRGFVGALYALDDTGWRADSGVDLQKAMIGFEGGRGASAATIKLAFYNLAQETAGFVEGPAAYRDRALARANADPDAFRDARGARLFAAIDTTINDNLTLKVTPFARWNDMRFRLHFFPSRAIEENAQWSIGAQTAFYFDSPRLSVAGGFDLDYSDGELSETQFLPTTFSYTQGVHYDYRVKATSLSPFVRIAAELPGGLTAEIAARLDNTRMTYDNRTADGVIGRFLRPPDRRDRFTTFSPKASVKKRIGEGLVYASYARGARPPQTSDLYRLQINQTADPALPETIDAFEAGIKLRRGAAFGIDAAGYFMTKRNFFFRDADGYNVNDGRTRHVGGEVEAFARGPAGFSASGAASYARHTYRFSRGVLSLPQASEAIAFGADVDTAPRFFSNLSVRWNAPRNQARAEIEWSRVGRYFTDAANLTVYPGHDVITLRAGVRVARALIVEAALRNALDARYAERADYAFGTERYFPGEGRIASIGVRFDFEEGP